MWALAKNLGMAAGDAATKHHFCVARRGAIYDQFLVKNRHKNCASLGRSPLTKRSKRGAGIPIDDGPELSRVPSWTYFAVAVPSASQYRVGLGWLLHIDLRTSDSLGELGRCNFLLGVRSIFDSNQMRARGDQISLILNVLNGSKCTQRGCGSNSHGLKLGIAHKY